MTVMKLLGKALVPVWLSSALILSIATLATMARSSPNAVFIGDPGGSDQTFGPVDTPKKSDHSFARSFKAQGANMQFRDDSPAMALFMRISGPDPFRAHDYLTAKLQLNHEQETALNRMLQAFRPADAAQKTAAALPTDPAAREEEIQRRLRDGPADLASASPSDGTARPKSMIAILDEMMQRRDREWKETNRQLAALKVFYGLLSPAQKVRFETLWRESDDVH